VGKLKDLRRGVKRYLGFGSKPPKPGEQLSIRFNFPSPVEPHAQRLRNCFEQALALDHKLPPNILGLEGMSGRNYRYFINRLVESTPNARYLEVGSWKGSTVAAAAFGNTVKAMCIDNWSQFGGPKNDFFETIRSVASPSAKIDHIEADFRKVDYSAIGQHNIYLFDGPHARQDQYDGLMVAQPALDPIYTLIVDDWNLPPVRKGTTDALTKLNSQVVGSIEIRTTQDDTHPNVYGAASAWHDGYFIAVIEKRA
jgi:hypothetical protein